MKKSRLYLFFFSTVLVLTVLSSCKPGEGGAGSITGQVLFTDTSLTIMLDTADSAHVFISYGEDSPVSADDEVYADEDGMFTFKPLKKGDYYISVEFYHPLIQKEYRGGMMVTLTKDENRIIEYIECE